MRLVAVVMFAVIFAQPMSASGGGLSSPTRPPLFASGSSTSAVPGLPSTNDFTALLPTSGPAPSRAQCVVAWNRRGPPLTLHWLSMQRPAEALVTVGHMTTSNTSGSMCDLYVRTAHRQIVEITGPWNGGGVAAWQAFSVIVGSDALFQQAHNAAVAADGTLQLA